MQAQQLNYEDITAAIRFLKDNKREHPKLKEVAEYVNMSPYRFQQLFQEWAGISPKHFLQYLSTEYTKRILQETRTSLSDTTRKVVLHGTDKPNKLSIYIVRMLPEEYRNGGENLNIHYRFTESPFGKIFVASTHKGICYLEFTDDYSVSTDNLKRKFPNAHYKQGMDEQQQNFLFIFTQGWNKLKEIKLHLKGTDFQLKVWKALLKIPMGGLTTYGDIAADINHPKACRAVGTAIGANPVAFLIPCHRVIRTSGELGNYHWGTVRKASIIGWEAARKE